MGKREFELVIRKEAFDKGKDYDGMSLDERKEFINEILKERIPVLAKEFGVTEAEFMELSEIDQRNLAMEYMFFYENTL